jgi:hypothetical protein
VAKQGSDFAVDLREEDFGLDTANRVGCGTLPRIIFRGRLMQRFSALSALSAHVFPNFQSSQHEARSGQPPGRAASERHWRRTVVNVGR